jgi:hypothetical protein
MKAGKILVAAVVLGLAATAYQMQRTPGASRAKEAGTKTPALSIGQSSDSKSSQRPVSQAGPVTGNETLSPSKFVSARPSTADTADQLARKAKKHVRYDPLFRRLGLTPAESDQFVELLTEQDDARTDLQVAVKDQNLPGNSPEIEKLRSALYAPIVQRIRDLLGPDGYDAYASYEKTSYYRDAFVSPMLADFTTTAAPLSDSQFTQLTDVIAANDHPYQRAPTDVGNESSIDWQTVLSQSSSFLTPAQLAVIRARASHPRRG